MVKIWFRHKNRIYPCIMALVINKLLWYYFICRNFYPVSFFCAAAAITKLILLRFSIFNNLNIFNKQARKE